MKAVGPVAVLLSSVLSVAFGANPWFCHGLDCPTFTSLKNITENGQTIDMRNYPEQLWVSTNITDEEYAVDVYTSHVYTPISHTYIVSTMH